ncbi:DUF6585 family protein [Nocardia sp. NPDC127579]|uniref:DUF6585 family protein n=1 Tax=Nocardia sp. NPDC127579 TaxID=3345402 RepID=UPI00362F727C
MSDGTREAAEMQRWRNRVAQLGPRTEAVPEDALAMAGRAGLGRHQNWFGEPKGPSVAWSIGCGTVIAVIGVAIALLLSGWWIAIPIVLAAGGVLFAAYAYFGPDEVAEQVYVFEHGMIHRESKGQLTVLRWSEIRLLANVTRHYSQGGYYTRSSHNYTLLRADGGKTFFTHLLFPDGELAVLGELIEQRVTEVRVPKAIEAVSAGQRLDFGDLIIDASGISSKHGTLPWPEVESVEPKEGKIVIKKSGNWLRWSKTPVSEIPDVSVLLLLSAALRATAGGR